jgi:molybdate transport system substrate-binding protein
MKAGGEPIVGISSMATRTVLAELAAAYEDRTGKWVSIESVGGVDAAKRVRAGEPFDVVVLARDALDELLAERCLIPGTDVDLIRSSVGVAVRADGRRPDVGSEEALRRAVMEARSIGISTGPSGVQLRKLFERWGLAEDLRKRTLVATPGVPVAALVAHGEAELGFQQLSELIHVEGVAVLGALPVPIQIVTTFAAAVGARSLQPDEARQMLAFLSSTAAADAKRRQGMDAP